MLRIGLTGGIGSGKTTVANHFSALGIDVIDADVIVHQISQPGEAVFAAIIEAFGNSVLNLDGTLNRKHLGEIVFNDNTARKKLESIIHPEVRRRMLHAITEVKSPYCVLVIPLLIETGFTDMVDRVLVIAADMQQKVQRVQARDEMNEELIKSIMDTQATDGERKKIADDVIENTGSITSLKAKTEELDRLYRQLSSTA
jgi:dephospho-CoA kinase